MLKYALLFFLSTCFCLILTPLAKWWAFITGAVDVPDERRVHREPSARFGGLSIFASIALGAAIAALLDPLLANTLIPRDRESIVLVAAASAMMIVGLIDDCRELGPWLKLALEITAAVAVVLYDYRIGNILGVRLGWLELPVTVAWLVAVTNAFNMIDGLDGLAAGVGAMVTTTLFLLSLYLGNVGAALILALLGGALVGFLPYNFHPARIFLGDSGSLFIGFVLAVTSVATSNKLVTIVAILVPILALGLPLAELVVTTLRRLLRVMIVQSPTKEGRYRFRLLGSPGLFTADRDHIHHRLMSLGMTHRNAVLMLYGGCLVLCVGALSVVVLKAPGQALLTSAVAIVSVASIGRLGYQELRLLRNGLLLPLFDSRALSKGMVQALLDLGFIVIAIFGAYLIQYGGVLTLESREELRRSVPIVAIGQIACFAVYDLYRRAYRYAGVADLLVIVRAVVVAVTLSWGLAFLVTAWRGGNYPRLSIAVLDLYLLATLVIASRLSFLVLDHLFKTGNQKGARMLVYGADSAGIVALTEIKNNPALNMTVVGFLDDRDTEARTLQGVPIYGPKDVESLIAGREFDGLVLCSKKQDGQQLRHLIERCAGAGLSLRRFQIGWSEIDTGATDSAKGQRYQPEQLPIEPGLAGIPAGK